MGIQNLSENLVFVDLPPEPELNEELKMVGEVVREEGDCNVLMDFSRVDIVTSSSLSKLLKLRKLLLDWDRRLILSHVGVATRGIFSVTALEDVFDMVEDKSAAIAALNEPANR